MMTVALLPTRHQSRKVINRIKKSLETRRFKENLGNQ